MLETLRIRSIATIDSTEISFMKGLNILSGETGAGKSIVIEAISLLLGSRANSDLIRSDCDEAVIEGVFDTSEISWLEPRLHSLGLRSESHELLIKRTVHRGGKHRITVNGEITTLSALQTLCEGLVDLCGQNEHQSLLKSTHQLELIDRFGDFSELTKVFGSRLLEIRELIQRRDDIKRADSERVTRTDFIRFQIEELRQAGLIAGEDDQLQQEKQLLQSAGQRANVADSVRQIFEDDETGLLHSSRNALVKLKNLVQLDVSTAPLKEGLERALVELEEVGIGLHRYLSGIDVNQERLEEVQSRLSLIANLRRKYGATVSEILTTLARLENELTTLGKTDVLLQEIEGEIEKRMTELNKLGRKLSIARGKTAHLLSTSVTAELKDLKMSDAQLNVEISAKHSFDQWTESGADLVQFAVRTNMGEPAKPLHKIASGGELSRLMLAIRRVISDRGGIGVYLFDEIDAGIGGQTAFQVGRKLKSVAKFNQVICITHLPQVAAFADHHLAVRKSTRGKRTVTEVLELPPQERKQELARMLGGPTLTRRSLENAAELLELSNSTI